MNTIEENVSGGGVKLFLLYSLLTFSFLFGILFARFLDPFFPDYFSISKSSYNSGHSLGFSEAKNIVEKSSIAKFFPKVIDKHSISGNVVSINGDTLTVHSQMFFNPFEGNIPELHNFRISSNTKVFILVEKDQKTLKEEFDKMQKIKNSTTTNVLSEKFSLYKEVEANMSDISVGDSVDIRTDGDIGSESLTAKEIFIKQKINK